MNGRVFVDSNVLIYAYDLDAGAKHQTAADILESLWDSRLGVLSMQVLQEFYVNVTRKIPHPLSKKSARAVVDAYAAWCVVTTPSELTAAFCIEDDARLGFWDALILAAASKAGASRILSEDLNQGQKISGLSIENPFLSP
jgi:predicted nucleic acid-binding protein